MDEPGFPAPSKVPAPYNLLKQPAAFTNINELDTPELSNQPYQLLSENIKSVVTPIAQSTYLVICNNLAIGTAILLSPNIFIIAKHCIDSFPNSACIYAVSGYVKSGIECCHYTIEKIIKHDAEDVALLITNSFPVLQYGKYAECDFDEQPAGKYFNAHHAGGLPLQISTGLFPTFGGNFFSLQHFLLADAGPLASGAGVFDGASLKLIGINTRRTPELECMSRKILTLATIKNWLLKNLMDNSLSPAKNISSMPSLVQIPPMPLLIDFSLKDLYSEDFETMTWVRAQVRAQATQAFLNQLHQFTSGQIQRNAINIPEFLIANAIFDSHQSQHFGTRLDKTRVNPNIGSNVLNPLLIALAASITEILSLFLTRVPEADRKNALSNGLLTMCANNNTEWAIEFGSIIIGHALDRVTPATIARIDGNPFGKFHFYPIANNDDDIRRVSVNIIDAANLLNYIINFKPVRAWTFYHSQHTA